MDTRFRNLETLATLALASCVIAMLSKNVGFYYLATVLLVLGLFVKSLSGIITTGWLKFSHILGNINSKVLLGAVFFLVLSPIGFLYRKFKGDPMKIKRANPQSNWVEKNHLYVPADFEHTW